MRNISLEKSCTKCDKGTILRLFSKKPTFGLIFQSLEAAPARGVLSKTFSENMQQIYRRTPKAKCDFNKVALQIY